ncbi:MAG TPA: FAD binding domain-containing protein [Anaerolineae bacterium]|nr:FAD binding domain-containing protein [Anaerolineae bacterium]
MPGLLELTEYHKPTSIEAALELLRRPQIHSVLIAGGTSVVAAADHAVQAVIDLSNLNLAYIKSTEQGVKIGATTTLQQILNDRIICDYADGVLSKAILDTATLNTRNAASIAGSIVASKGNSPLFTVLLAIDTHLSIRGERTQHVALSEWAGDDKTLIVEIVLPLVAQGCHFAYEKVARTPTDLPIVCVAVCATASRESISGTRIAIGGVGDRPMVLTQPVNSIEQAVELARESIEPSTDYFASGEYRREMIGVLVKRTLENISHF